MDAPKILFVDDDTRILTAIDRQFSDDYNLETAVGPVAGLEAIEEDGPFAVVISDMRMPDMSGIEMLRRVREISPDTVRVMLTGYADLNSTIEAVNEGNIFRFLSKPCSMDVLRSVINDGIRQFRLVTSEHELVEGTLKGSIKVLFDVLGLVNPEAFGRASRVKRIAMAIASQLALDDIWEIEIAAMMSALGCVSLPETTLQKLMAGEELSAAERNVYNQHPALGKSLLEKIPRLSNVASIVGYQEKNFDGSGIPDDDLKGNQIPIGARILKVAIDFDMFETRRQDRVGALSRLRQHPGHYDPEVVRALAAVFQTLFSETSVEMTVRDLRIGMVFAQNVHHVNGQLLIGRGQEVTNSALEVLSRMARNNNVQQPFRVFIKLKNVSL